MQFCRLSPESSEQLRGAAQLILDYLTPECLLALYDDKPAFVALDDDCNNVVGTALLSPIFEPLPRLGLDITGCFRVDCLVVSQASRKRGVGGRLLGMCLDEAFSLGARQVILECRSPDHAGSALGICRRVAAFSLGRRADYYPDRSEAEILVALPSGR